MMLGGNSVFSQVGGRDLKTVGRRVAHVRVSLPGADIGVSDVASSEPATVEITPALLGLGAYLATVIRVLGLSGAMAAQGVHPVLEPLMFGICWGALAVGIATLASCLLSRWPEGGVHGLVWRAAVSLVFVTGLAMLTFGGESGPALVRGVSAGVACGLAGVLWIDLYAGRGTWEVTLHALASLCIAGALVLLGGLWGVVGVPASVYTMTLVALAAAAQLAAPGCAREAGVFLEAGETTPDVRSALRDFARSQWVPLSGVCLLLFVHGLRWRSAILGFSDPKPYDINGVEFF